MPALRRSDALMQADADLDTLDVAAANLHCAAGLPGTERIDLAACGRRLRGWAGRIRRETERSWPIYRRKPSHYWGSRAKFRMLVMVTVLQKDLGVKYDLSCMRDPIDLRDARPWFLCGPLAGRGGTCASLPVLYLAIGRRLGYPLHLVAAKEHLFVRWEEPGERFNVECTSSGFEPRDDEYHRRRPRPLSDAELATGLFLRNLTSCEILAEFYAQRGHCLLDHLRVDEALEAYYHARMLAPGHRGHETASAVATMLRHVLDGERRGTGPTFKPRGHFQESAMALAKGELARIRGLHAVRSSVPAADRP